MTIESGKQQRGYMLQWEICIFTLKIMNKHLSAFTMPFSVRKGGGNPYIHLRLGQLYFEEGSFDESADELTRAYMGGGLGILLEDDPKYLEFLETKIVI